MAHPDTWLCVRPEGLYCVPGDFFIDPTRPVARAVVTHAHADHARPGHGAVMATAETLAIMGVRMGVERAGESQQALRYGEVLTVGQGVRVSLHPAGHVLGSAQVLMEWGGARAVVSGDYKRASDPTCAGFAPVECDVFVTEATFALPVFTHPPAFGGGGAVARERRVVSGADACGGGLCAGQMPAGDCAAASVGMGPAGVFAWGDGAGLRGL